MRESALQGRARLRRKASGQGMAFELDLQGSGRWTCGDEGEETTAAGDTQEPAWLERRVVGRLVVLGASWGEPRRAVPGSPWKRSTGALPSGGTGPSSGFGSSVKWVCLTVLLHGGGGMAASPLQKPECLQGPCWRKRAPG